MTKEKWITFKEIESVHKVKLLGVHCQENLNGIATSKKLRKGKREALVCCASVGLKAVRLAVDVGIAMFCSKMRPLFEYAGPIWGDLQMHLTEGGEKVQNRSLSIIVVPRDSFEKLGIRRIETTKREL